MSGYLANLSQAITAMHGCSCQHEATSHVHEMMDGKTVWKGNVETFILENHPKATYAFAWGYTDKKGEIRYIAVLNVPPINSPREAVQAAIVAASKADRKP